MLQTDGDGIESLTACYREDTGIDDRRLADTRPSVEHGLRVVNDVLCQALDLVVASIELLTFQVEVQAFPRIGVWGLCRIVCCHGTSFQ